MRTLVFTLDNGNLNSHEVRVFCAAAMNAAPSSVEFPQVAEIHVNGTSGNLYTIKKHKEYTGHRPCGQCYVMVEPRIKTDQLLQPIY
ncbi:hypothetical protein O0I10_004856 [Lichtheimia ornata]|uniref:Uncharacterized protein n=1 Tax=Lichtheimia ornata TaxID=688661 RepID=A0AAD7V6N1_9FUNG|nr:uncharacterized protein O0I10_004856 [Lichtheimia ornata]KAJ8659491.1 hypothetical protein O0I10_004856 [Lichtheimia ornata]